MLLSIEEIECQLEEKFSAFNGELDDLKLIRRSHCLDDIEAAEKQFGIRFPEDFLSFISIYNLDICSLGKIAFGTGTPYLEWIVKINQPSELGCWWSGSRRPEGIIVIALSDPYTILLNTLDRQIYTMTSESEMDKFELVAINFNSFIRGIGSIFLNAASASEIEIKVGAGRQSKFWQVIGY